MGFNAPSKIQETALPTLLADPPQNMIAQSQSGTGKTAAFVLAMLSRVNTSLKHTQVTFRVNNLRNMYHQVLLINLKLVVMQNNKFLNVSGSMLVSDI